MTALKVEMPTPLRRFASIKISSTKVLLIGGLEKMGKESDAVSYLFMCLHWLTAMVGLLNGC